MKKTTLNIDEGVMAQLKEEAMRRKTTMGALVEAGIRLILAEGRIPAPLADELPPLPIANMGEPLVDVADREALYAVLDREKSERLYGAPTTLATRYDVDVPEPGMRAVAEEPVTYDVDLEAPDGTDED